MTIAITNFYPLLRLRNLVISFVVEKRFLATLTADATPSPPSSSSFTVRFLIDSCGLSSESALSVSLSQNTKFQLRENNLQNPQSVLHFLKAHNFTDSQIAKVIEKRPQLLHARVENSLKPKFEFFIKNGFVGQILPEFIVSTPIILSRGLDSNIKPCFELLKSLFGSDEKAVEAVLRCEPLLSYLKGALKPNVELLIKEGVPVHKVTKFLMTTPRVVLVKHDKMANAVNALKSLGIEPKAPMFGKAIKVMLQMNNSTRKKKIETLKSFGWNEEEILGAFKRNPCFLSCSEDKIRRMTDFIVNTLKLRPSTLIARPEFLSYSIDRRLRPRHNVWEVLVSKKLIKDQQKHMLRVLFLISEKDFQENYVSKYEEEVPGLVEIYGVKSKGKNMDA